MFLHGRNPPDTSHGQGRVCATTGYFAPVPVGISQALIFGQSESIVGVTGRQCPILFEWIHAESPDAVIGALRRVPDDFKADTELTFDVTSDRIKVFEFTFSGGEFEAQPGRQIPVAPGLYVIASTLYTPDDDTGLIIYRFVPD